MYKLFEPLRMQGLQPLSGSMRRGWLSFDAMASLSLWAIGPSVRLNIGCRADEGGMYTGVCVIREAQPHYWVSFGEMP